MRYIGIDLSKHTFSAAYLDEVGKVVEQKTFYTDAEGMNEFLKTLNPEDAVALEAGNGMYRFYDILISRVHEVTIVINTYKFKVIKSSIKKTDANDVVLIARFLRMNELPEVYVVEEAYRQVRELTVFRKKLIGQNTMMRNRINALFQKYGVA
ncbi:MAG: IS110 family transposase [Spirochaetota bacterium]